MEKQQRRERRAILWRAKDDIFKTTLKIHISNTKRRGTKTIIVVSHIHNDNNYCQNSVVFFFIDIKRVRNSRRYIDTCSIFFYSIKIVIIHLLIIRNINSRTIKVGQTRASSRIIIYNRFLLITKST